MGKWIHKDIGGFQMKGDEPRQVRSLRLTDNTWTWLGSVADELGITRADLIEQLASEGQLGTDPDDVREQVLIEIEALVDELLADEDVTRGGKDHEGIHRALAALLKRLR